MPFKKAFLCLIAALTLVGAPLAANAQTGAKIGYVNTERILRDAAPAKAAQRKLEKEFAERDRELQAMAGRLKSMGETLERDRAILTETERRRRQRDFADLEKEFQRKQREFREDLNQRRNEELAQVLDRANRAIRQMADTERFDLIVQDAVFASPRIDITEQVIKALGN
ncbi:MAG: OmpH family outer membrane protein [Burkholderiaceae bacterium]